MRTGRTNHPGFSNAISETLNIGKQITRPFSLQEKDFLGCDGVSIIDGSRTREITELDRPYCKERDGRRMEKRLHVNSKNKTKNLIFSEEE